MSLEGLAIVLHHSRAKGTDKLVLIGIANHDGDGGAWPALETLAKYAGGIDERNVRRSLRRLEDLGEVLTHVQAGGSSGVPIWRRPNRYEVLVACPPTCDRTKHHREKKPPSAPADLWITGGAPTSPGGASVPTPGAPASPHPGAPASPEPSNRTDHETGVEVPEVTTDRGREPICNVCSLGEALCRSRVATSGHEFEERH